MDKKDLIFLAAAQATTAKYSHAIPASEENQEAVKSCFRLWHKILSELHDELT